MNDGRELKLLTAVLRVRPVRWIGVAADVRDQRCSEVILQIINHGGKIVKDLKFILMTLCIAVGISFL